MDFSTKVLNGFWSERVRTICCFNTESVKIKKKFNVFKKLLAWKCLRKCLNCEKNVFSKNVFSNSQFWLPSNVTWKDIEPGSHGINHANYIDLLYYPVPMSLLLIVLRLLIER